MAITGAQPYQRTILHYNLMILDAWMVENLYEESHLYKASIHMVKHTKKGANFL